MVREVGSNTGHEIGLMMGNEANGAIKHSKPETAQINSLIRFSSLPQQPLVDPLAAYLATLAPKSQAVVKERLATVARLIGVDPAAMPWHELRAHHLDYIRGRLGEEDPLTKKKRAPATINLTLAALRGVLKQARNQNLLTDEEYRRVTEVKGARGSRLPAGRAVPGGELKALVEACRRDPSPAGARDAAILAVLYIGGVRRTELVSLDLADYTADPPTLRVRHGKGDKERLVPLTATAGAALAAWLARRGDHPGKLFLPVSQVGAVHGDGLSSIAVYNMLQKRAAQAGVPHVSPHDLRRSFVSDLLDAGVDLSAAQQLAGHASVVTTARYDRRGETAKRQGVEKLHFPFR
jgi:integrase